VFNRRGQALRGGWPRRSDESEAFRQAMAQTIGQADALARQLEFHSKWWLILK
jgi:hypothetical protein